MNLNTPAAGRASDLSQLRKLIDGNDTFMNGHNIRYGNGRLHSTRGDKVPEWTKSDEGIQRLLLKVFPKLKTNKQQRAQAGRWARVIYLYFRARKTYSQIAEDMQISFNAAHELVKHIQRASKGRSCNGSGIYRRRGRPKKIVTQASLSFR